MLTEQKQFYLAVKIAGYKPAREMEVFPYVSVSCGDSRDLTVHHYVAKKFCLFSLTWPTIFMSEKVKARVWLKGQERDDSKQGESDEEDDKTGEDNKAMKM